MKKLESYWPAYKDCPECGKRQKNNKTYFKCKDSDCSYTEKQFIINNKREARVRPIVEDMVDYLLTNDPEFTEPLPQVKFPDEAIMFCDKEGELVEVGDFISQPGWCLENYFERSINVPQKALYLPNREIIEVTGHETSHASTRLGHKDERWHKKYMDYRGKLFSKYSDFANEHDEDVRYTLNFSKEFYKKHYGFDLEDLKYDPNEDD